MGKKTAIIDFDGTICGFAFPLCGPPEPGVREGLQKLHDAGYKIVIHSVSTGLNWGYTSQRKNCERIKAFMHRNELLYDEIYMLSDKPIATVYIDDRSVGYRGNWKQTVEEVIELGDYE